MTVSSVYTLYPLPPSHRTSSSPALPPLRGNISLASSLSGGLELTRPTPSAKRTEKSSQRHTKSGCSIVFALDDGQGTASFCHAHVIKGHVAKQSNPSALGEGNCMYICWQVTLFKVDGDLRDEEGVLGEHRPVFVVPRIACTQLD